MKTIFIVYSLLSTINLFASGIGKTGNYKERTDWQNIYKEEGFKADCTVTVKETRKVKGMLDGKGCLYKWTGKYAEKCHSKEEFSEDVPSMFDMEPGSTIKNMKIECAPDGITMNDDTVIDNIAVWDCEEDCVNTKGKNNTIKNSKFYLAQDKSIQLNKAENVLITNNIFKHAGRGLSGSGKVTGGAKKVQSLNNKFFNVELAIRAQRNHDIKVKNNFLDGGEALLESVEDSVIYDCGGNEATGGAVKVSKDSKKIKSCP